MICQGVYPAIMAAVLQQQRQRLILGRLKKAEAPFNEEGSLPSAQHLAEINSPWITDGQQFRNNLADLTRYLQG